MVDPEPCKVIDAVDTPPTLELDISNDPDITPSPANGNPDPPPLDSNVVTLVANVTAQKQAVISATSALEATQVGYKVGTRNIVDLLQAEKNLYSAEKNLANAKYDYIIAKLKLSLAAGTITPGDLVNINSLLE